MVRLLLDSDPHDDEAPQAGAVPQSMSGALRKMAKGPKGHDYLQSVAVELSATGGLSWTASSATGDPAGSQEDLAPGEMLSVASCSSTGAEHAFEVVSCVKGTNAPPVHHQFVAQSESECGGQGCDRSVPPPPGSVKDESRQFLKISLCCEIHTPITLTEGALHPSSLQLYSAPPSSSPSAGSTGGGSTGSPAASSWSGDICKPANISFARQT